jgi:orotate phosphoribosyltransferase
MGQVRVVESAALAAIVRRCHVDVEVVDSGGHRGRGWTNLKRIYGHPGDLRLVVEALATTVGDSGAIASTDEGSAPLAALVAWELERPAVFVGVAKRYGIAWGKDPNANEMGLAGDILVPGTTVHLVDDFVYSGASIAAAADRLRDARLIVSSAAALLGSPPDSIQEAIDSAGIALTIFVRSDRT